MRWPEESKWLAHFLPVLCVLGVLCGDNEVQKS